MKVVGLAGYSGAGKTTLIERLIPALRQRGQRVSVIKHAHHGFDIDHPGKDSWRHRQAGAYEVLVVSDQRLALMRELQAPPDQPSPADAARSESPARPKPEPPDIATLLAELDHRADWVLVEGYKHAGLSKIEVWRAPPSSCAQPRQTVPGCLYPHDARVLALVTSAPGALPQPTLLPIFPPDAADALAHWLLEHAERFAWG